jgi:hypothetical protein
MIMYLFIGTVFTFCIDLLTNYLTKIGMPQRSLTNQERLMCILIWPIGLIVFLVSFIKTKFEK